MEMGTIRRQARMINCVEHFAPSEILVLDQNTVRFHPGAFRKSGRLAYDHERKTENPLMAKLRGTRKEPFQVDACK